MEIFSVGELTRWLSKPPDPLATQTHEPKMKVAPRGGVMVLKAKVTIELADEFAEPPHLARQLSVFTAKPAQGYP